MAARSEHGDIEVRKALFDADPKRYIRQATSERRVIVRHDTGRVSAVFGGSLAVLPDGTPVGVPPLPAE